MYLVKIKRARLVDYMLMDLKKKNPLDTRLKKREILVYQIVMEVAPLFQLFVHMNQLEDSSILTLPSVTTVHSLSSSKLLSLSFPSKVTSVKKKRIGTRLELHGKADLLLCKCTQ